MATHDDARRALLSRLIDHAPLFPPASLPLEEALVEDARAAASPHAWMLARFVCPASLLGRLTDPGRGISVVLDAPIPSGVAVESVETRVQEDLAPLGRLARDVYVEVPLDGVLDERLGELASLGLRAKVRCGGEEVPDVDDLAAFVRGCRSRSLVFKATAGLHHALRSEAGHGFLNVLAAAVFGDEEEVLRDDDPDAFQLDEQAFSWRDRIAPADELARVRDGLLHSIGSCSFFEPVEELESMGMFRT